MTKCKIGNAFAISMLPTDRITTVSFAGPRTAEDVRRYAAENQIEFESVIGHTDTAKLVGEQIGVDLPGLRPLNRRLGVGISVYIDPKLN